MARLVIETGPEKGKEIKLPDQGEIVFGRDTTCGYQILDLAASRNHFKILAENSLWTLQDLNSRNGTHHNGDKVEMADLSHGDLIRVGEAVFKFDDQGASAAAAPQVPPAPEPAPITDYKYKDPLVGRVVGGYKLLDQIGRGGMGTVYIANQLSLSRDVALKILSPKYTSDEKFVEMFVREARAAGALNHPNIVQVYDVGRDGDMHFFSMEYMSKGSVGDLLKQLGKISVPRALAMIIHAAKGLEYAEKRGLIHCDIKPDNLMLNDDGTVKIVDLGLSRTTMGEKSSEESDVVFGTPNFVSPEQAQRKKIDHRVDQYSLGAAFFNLITGKPPFSGESAREIVKKHINEPPPLAKDVDPAIPDSVSRIIDRMLKKNPDERYPSSTALLEDLRVANIGINPQAAYTDGFPGMAFDEKPRNRGLVALVIAGAAAVLLAAILLPLLFGGNGGDTPGNGGEPAPQGQPPSTGPGPEEKQPPPEKTDPLPDPNPGAGKTDEEKFDEQCQLAAECLKDTRELQKKHGDFDPAVIERLKAIGQKYPGTPAAKEAEESAAEMEKQLAARLALDEAASKLLKEIEAAAKAALEQGRFGDALKAYDRFPMKEYEGCEAAGEVAKARLFIDERLKDAWTVGFARATGLERQGDFEGAKKFYSEVVEVWRVETYSERAREESERIDRVVASRHEAAAAAVLQKEKAAFGKAEAEALELAKAYSFAAAAERVGALLSASNPGGALTLKDFAEKAARMKTDLDHLAALKKSMIQRGNDKSGSVKIMLPSTAPGGGREAIVVRADENDVRIKLGAADTVFTWQSFAPQDFLDAALRFLSPDILPIDRLRIGLFALMLGVPDKVEQQLSAAAREGDNIIREQAERALKRFQSGAGIAGQQIEARAEAEYRRINELFRKAEAEPNHEEAVKTLRQALEAFDAWREEYGHTQFARNR